MHWIIDVIFFEEQEWESCEVLSLSIVKISRSKAIINLNMMMYPSIRKRIQRHVCFVND